MIFLLVRIMKRNKFYQLLDQNGLNYDRELCDYGINVLKNYLLYISIMLIPVIHYHLFLDFLIFLFLYIPTRKNIGGVHLTSKLTCLLFSVLITFLITISSKYNFFHGFLTIVLFHFTAILLLILIIKFGSIKDDKKSLNNDEKEYYKTKSVFIIIFYYLLFVISLLLNITKISNSIFCIFLMFLMNYIIWKIKKT